MSSVGSYKRTLKPIKWVSFLPLWMQPKRKNVGIAYSGLIDIDNLEELPVEHAKGLVNDAINRNLNHLTETQVYIKIVHFMVECRDKNTKLSNELYKHCDKITKDMDNGRVK